MHGYTHKDLISTLQQHYKLKNHHKNVLKQRKQEGKTEIKTPLLPSPHLLDQYLIYLNK
jgi:hypothetical protein